MTDRSPTDSSWPLTTLPWQRESWLRLQRAVASDSLAHALLLSGGAGIGKTHFSCALAGLLLCHQADATGACGHCRSCQLLQAGSHSDLLHMVPEPGSRVIKIDQVRTLIDFANQTSGLGPRKVMLINPAEALNLNAANALLKCLEEPAAGTHLLLVSHASSRLPATIRSRCQLLTLPAPAPEQTRSWLDQMTGDATTSAALLEMTGNRPTAALHLHHSEGLQQQQALQQGLDALAGGAISAIQFPQLVAELELAEVLGLLAGRLQTAIKAAVQDQPGDLRQHFLLLDELLRLQRAVLHGGNPNRQLTIENCAAELARVLGAGQ
ncbi:MAG: DNA polymerase III subunit delta' [Gammaproteobacteria bacterium]|nr:DNA polymerase III subunit delta' [Gammaproteobacteria bacterium]